MTTLPLAIEDVTPLLRAALAKAVRPAIPFSIAPQPHALATVPGSLEPYLSAPGAPELPYANALAAVLADALPPGPNSRGFWPTTPATENSAEDSTETAAQQQQQQHKSPLPFNAPLWTSKIGGFGYLPKGFPYPMHTKKNRPLQLLLQLNLSELRAQCVAYGKHTGKESEEDAAACFLPSPLWPTQGILALYTDPFDFCWGCNFVARDPQEGYRFLYFEQDYEERILPLLREHLSSGNARTDEVERQLAELMWSREEQYAVFTKALAANEGLLKDTPLSFLSAGNGADDAKAQLDKDKMTLTEVAWLLRHGTATPTDHKGTGAGVQPTKPHLPELEKLKHQSTSSTLWYGTAINKEHVVGVNTARMSEEVEQLGKLLAANPDLLSAARALSSCQVPLMVPTNSVEFNQLVLYRALRGPKGRELLQVIRAITEDEREQFPCAAQSKDDKEEGQEKPVPRDQLDEVHLGTVNYFNFLTKRLAAMHDKRTKKETEEKDADKDDGSESEEDEEDEDDCSYEYSPIFTNQLGGYPNFTQEDLRFMAYSRHDGGFKVDKGKEPPLGAADEPGMLIFPENHQHEADKALPDAPSTTTTTAVGTGNAAQQTEVGDDKGTVPQRDPEDGAIVADVCLFQISECSDVFMVGDAGIANAFIPEEDLRQRRFDRAWFSYDCC